MISAMAKELKMTFTDWTNTIPVEYHPIPAKKVLPAWYKDMNSYVRGKKEIFTGEGAAVTSSTIKKCMPVFDALTAGYMLLLPCDIYVYQDGGSPAFKCPDYNFMGTHSPVQIGAHPSSTGFAAPKFVNTWVIKTPPGYSCLFIPPLHHDNMFKILEGVVDTDTYQAAVELPFELKDTSWEGIIPAGTPMAQIIPFKRESWVHEVINTEKEAISQYVHARRLRAVFFEAYKNKFWHKKDFN
jgi:hypothetical protein